MRNEADWTLRGETVFSSTTRWSNRDSTLSDKEVYGHWRGKQIAMNWNLLPKTLMAMNGKRVNEGHLCFTLIVEDVLEGNKLWLP